MILRLILGILSIPLDAIYWLKRAATYVAIRIHRAVNRRRFDLYEYEAVNAPEKQGILVPPEEIRLESPFPESHLTDAADEIFIYGVNSKSECLIARVARGCNQEAEAWIYLKLNNGKTYHLAETVGYQQIIGDKCLSFSCGGLQMQYLNPMRRWRIFFNGMLIEKNQDDETQSKKVFVKFTFLWTASSDVYDATTDMDPSTVADAMAKAKWKSLFLPPLNSISELMDFYAQSGVIRGIISTDENPNYDMYLFGEKMRYFGKSTTTAGSRFTHILGNIPQTGLVIHLGKASAPGLFKKLHFGFVVQPNSKIKVVERAHIVSKLFSPVKLESSLEASFSAGKNYELSGNIVGDPIMFTSGKGWSGYVELRYIEFKINDKKGSGFLIMAKIQSAAARPTQIQCPKVPKAIPLVVNFRDEVSHFSEVSGGKGSSLGKLTKLSNDDGTFVVPRGIIVTTAAFSEFLTSEIENEIKNLETVVYGNIAGNVIETCKRVSDVVVSTSLSRKICDDIEKHLSKIYGSNVNHQKFAVRSSATGEDTEQMSAAGQMDTFLAVQGLKEILTAVKKCWASQFGHIAVEYKRRNGQPLNSPMAVVIQEMAECEVAGVLFTCDPLTNNPSVITITGNYGLGETVVSGSEEPDTVVLERDGDEVVLKSVNIGAKHHRIVMQDNGGTITEDVPENERNECCLSQEMALKLGKLAIKIEKHYKSPRDIEWGIRKGTIYILQSRPVTSGTAETDFEIKHEFDAPLRCEREYISVSNVGEVMPGATSPLGVDVVMKYFGSIFKKPEIAKNQSNNFMQNKYYSTGMGTFYNHMTMTVSDLISRTDGENDSVIAQGMMIGIFGRMLDDPDLISIVQERKPDKTKKGIGLTLRFLKNLFFAAYGLENVKKRVEEKVFPVEKCKTSIQTFHVLMNSFSDNEEAFVRHLSCTEISMIWNMLMFAVLGKAKGSFDTEVYGDFAKLLSTSTNVESADVPSAMQNLAQNIGKDMKSEDFKAMPVEEAQKWLESSTTVSGYKFRQFIKRHGHRCLKEFDIRSIPWEKDSKPLVKLLQNMSGACENVLEKKDANIEKIFSELRVPLDFKTRLLLKFLLPNCRRGVREREACKSILIKAVDNWRKGYIHLAKTMVAEGRIPDSDLIFFMTLEEINDLLQSRSPRIISRANNRRKLFPVMDKYLFPELMKGIPKPINEDEDLQTDEFVADLTMKGIPVSQGVTKGIARVALSLEEAACLQPGEILITYSTDIGWSPYFPILSGVVTELGGLISHGAVVSREYGLPCVVGLHGATRQFKTGDYVLLDGNKGVLQRLPKPES